MKPAQLGRLGGIAAGIAGGAAFLVFFFFLRLPVYVAIPVGIAAYIGFAFLFPAAGKPDVKETPENILTRTLEEGSRKLEEIFGCSTKIQNESMKLKVQGFCIAAGNILDNYKKDPSEFDASLIYYLDSVKNIVQKYILLSRQHIKTPEIVEAMKKSEAVVESVKISLEGQSYEAVKEGLIDLDAEIKVLERTIKTEKI